MSLSSLLQTEMSKPLNPKNSKLSAGLMRSSFISARVVASAKPTSLEFTAPRDTSAASYITTKLTLCTIKRKQRSEKSCEDKSITRLIH